MGVGRDAQVLKEGSVDVGRVFAHYGFVVPGSAAEEMMEAMKSLKG